MTTAEITMIRAGRYRTNYTREWWDDPRLSDTARERAVAAALGLPVEIVEVVFDSNEEVDLASVWLVALDHEKAIGHVTTGPDGTIVVEIPDEDHFVVELKTTEDHIRVGHQVRAYWTIEQAAATRLENGRLIVGSVYDTVDDSESETRFWCVTCGDDTEPGPETEIEYS